MEIVDDPVLRHFPTLLRRWDGCIARLWSLTTSHASLTVRVEFPGRVGNLEITGHPCFVHAPREWHDCHIEVARDESNRFLIIDAGADVRIVTEGLEIAENRNPLNAFTSAT